MLDPDRWKPTTPMKGVWLFFISRQRYLDAAIEHVAWLNLQAEDLRRKFLEGRFTPDSSNARALELRRFESLRKQFLWSFTQAALVALLALLVAVWAGAVDAEFPLHLGRAMGFVGAVLIGWAALFELGGPGLASWDGETLSEVIHPRIFQILFIPGTFALLCSVLL